jgi:PPE family
MGASGVNWYNVPHESIVSQINGGAGAGPVSDAAASYQRIAQTLRDADGDLRNALSATGASWEGRAASGMQAAATPLATWADEVNQVAVQTSGLSQTFGEQFTDTRAGIPPVVGVPSGSWVDDTGISAVPGVTTDRERAEAAADAAQQEAARRMEAYDNASFETVQPQYFSQPPTVVLEVPPPSAGGGPGVGGTSTTPGGPTDTRAYTAPASFAVPGGAVSPPSPVTGGAGVPSSPTAPAAVAPTPTIPGSAVGGLLGSGGGVPGAGSGGVVPPGIPGSGTAGPWSGGVRPGAPGSGRPGSGSSGSGGVPGAGQPPGIPLVSGRSFGPGFSGAGGYGPGGPSPSAGGAGGFGSGGASSAFGGLGSGGDDAHSQRGAGGFVPAGADADGRYGPAARPGMVGGGAGYGPMGLGGAAREDDIEHKRPDYLVETEDVWGDGTKVAPPVIGDRPAQ